MIVYLLTTGSGADGDEWEVKGIYSTLEKGEQAKKAYHEATGRYADVNLEKWEVDPLSVKE